jgi:hypothetical protein
VAIPKSPAPPSRSSLLRRIKALESQLQELSGDRAPVARVGSARPDPVTEIHDLVASGRPLAAVRRYRELTGAGEAEARTAIEELGGFVAEDA